MGGGTAREPSLPEAVKQLPPQAGPRGRPLSSILSQTMDVRTCVTREQARAQSPPPAQGPEGGGARGCADTPGLGLLVFLRVRVLILRVLALRPAPCHEAPGSQEAGGVPVARVLDEAGHCGQRQGGSACALAGGELVAGAVPGAGTGPGAHTHRSPSTGRTGTPRPRASRRCPGAS